jgi:GMP synthase-like glutamine amidotransferase
LGICFGAHLLCAALGGRVIRLPRAEIGWIDVASADDALVAGGPWMAWHEDALELPPLAYELARNPFGVQAFCHCRHLAVQFHPEVTPEILTRWAREGSDDLRRWDVDRSQLVVAAAEHAPRAAEAAERLFDGFAARAGLAAVASGA